MGNSGAGAGRKVTVKLDQNIFTLRSTELNIDLLSSTQDLISHFDNLYKPELMRRKLELEIKSRSSRCCMTYDSLRTAIESRQQIKITAREIGRLMIVFKAIKDGKFQGETTLFEAENTLTSELKYRAKKLYGITSDAYFYSNTIELEDSLTLAQNGIVEDSLLILMPKNESKLMLRSLVPNLTPWRIIKSGLNLEGVCDNPGCPAFSQRVVISLGFGRFRLQEESLFHYPCPICSETIRSFSKLGFSTAQLNSMTLTEM